MLKNSGHMNRFGSDLTELPYLERNNISDPDQNIQKTYRKQFQKKWEFIPILFHFIPFVFGCKTYFYAENI